MLSGVLTLEIRPFKRFGLNYLRKNGCTLIYAAFALTANEEAQMEGLSCLEIADSHAVSMMFGLVQAVGHRVVKERAKQP